MRSFGAWVSTRPTAGRMYRHGGGLLAISAPSSVFLELLSHQKSLRCHANCSVAPPGHVCATDCISDKCWDELGSVFKEKIIGIVIRVFSGPCRCGIAGCKWITCSLNSNNVLLSFCFSDFIFYNVQMHACNGLFSAAKEALEQWA